MSNPLRHGLTGNSAAARRRMREDEAAFREQQERAENEWKKDREMRTKKTPWGVANKPATTDKAQSNVDALGGLLNDLANAVREAQARERVIDSASDVDARRFPIVQATGGGSR